MKNSHRTALLLLAACLLSACATAPNTPASRTATASYPGKNVPGKCYIYGNSLYRQMALHGIPSWKIIFRGNLTSTGFQFAYHEVVVYQDAGKYWVVDNLNPYPSPIGGSNADEWVQHLCADIAGGNSFDYRIESVNDIPTYQLASSGG